MTDNKCRRIALVDRWLNTKIAYKAIKDSDDENEYVNRNGKVIKTYEVEVNIELEYGKPWRYAKVAHDFDDDNTDTDDVILQKRKRGRPCKEKTRTRGPSAYNIFVKSVMEQVKENNPGCSTRELMKKCAELWHAAK